ncbi:MAG TPA: hypothetical protein VNN74_01075 [Candidatus Micrarchaeia archaeon]|nr:hypothetical protein [Candidatus Micrarchaeia archaeon]
MLDAAVTGRSGVGHIGAPGTSARPTVRVGRRRPVARGRSTVERSHRRLTCSRRVLVGCETDGTNDLAVVHLVGCG